MKTLIRGEKVRLEDYSQTLQLEVELSIQANFTIDFTCFGLNEQRKLQDDRYMVFYNQLTSPNQEIQLHYERGKSRFMIDLSKLPSSISYLVFTATIDGNETMSQIVGGEFIVKGNDRTILRYPIQAADFQSQRAIIMGEVYYKSCWRVASIGQGFDGGLAALLTSFGGVLAPEPKQQVEQQAVPIQQASSTVPDKRIQLEKRLEKEAPHLVDLSKKAAISLEKVGLHQHTAKVALCLDISGSMSSLYASGKIQHFVERILALATRFDDDGSIDIFLFGHHAHDAGELTISNNREFIKKLLKKYPLERSTFYSKAITLIREHYMGTSSYRTGPYPQDIPVYVMFVTDGDTFDQDETTKQIVNASYEPIFWQFMAIDERRSSIFGRSSQSFSFLEKLDTLSGRYIDNAGFFSVKNPASLPDNELYDLLMKEYPEWIREAKTKGILLS